MDITETHLPRFLQIYVLGMRDGPRLMETEIGYKAGAIETQQKMKHHSWGVLSKRSERSQIIAKTASLFYF